MSDNGSPEKRLGNWFLFFSGLLAVFTIGAVFDETYVRRPWKNYQEEFKSLKLELLSKQIEEAKGEIDSGELQSLEEQIAVKEAELNSAEMQSIETKLVDLNFELKDLENEKKFAKSNSDEFYYFYKHSGYLGEDGSSYEEKLRKEEEIIKAIEPKIFEKKKEIAEFSAPLEKVQSELRELIKERNAKTDAVTFLEEKVQSTQDASIEIKQYVIADFTKGNFGDHLPKVERCESCHMGINDPVFKGADVAQPYSYHNDEHDLLKIHEPSQLGCTSCHAGQGIALTEHDAHEGDHHWLAPMYETVMDPYVQANLETAKHNYTQTSCFGCHSTANYLPGAETMLYGKKIVMDFGCYGCHNVPLTENVDAEKVGPPLNNIAQKSNPEWIADWIKHPKKFYKNTRMPNFYLSDEETENVTAYLLSLNKTNDYKPVKGYKGTGSVANGKELVEAVGCQACHVVGNEITSENRLKEGVSFGTELNKIGNKANGSWLYDWVKNPKKYHPESKMPSLRLSDKEAEDIVAYLLTLKDPNYKPSVALSDLTSAEKIEAGKNTVLKNGCYACHAINGTESEGKVSVSLGTIAKKTVDEFDFGDRVSGEKEVEGTWQSWVYHKVKEPRGFSTERIVSMMPDFEMTDYEAHAVTVLLKSWDGNFLNEKYAQDLSDSKRNFFEGQNFLRQRNCVGCHTFENGIGNYPEDEDGELGGYIRAHFENVDLAPPKLLGQGDKTQENWLTEFLNDVTPIRPWLKIRMPSFGFDDKEITEVHKYFTGAVKKDLNLTYYDDFEINKAHLNDGKKLFNVAQCTKCHLVNGYASPNLDEANLAPDLGNVKSRLQPDWLIKWLENPAAITPGTKMPGFFYYDEEEGVRYPLDPNILDGDADKQIKAIRDYVVSLSK
ncbi:MAG: hypothetical protein DWQ06_17015 [Calditrichaeota bacterium]|nr:MAG: hypothetical protein DWQ06_17015 [Calditrichota bacterium]